MAETGNISIHTENILPIIKKWLYSEKEIFLRELVSNAADAIAKLENINLLGEVTTEIAAPKISIAINKDAKTLSITDTGLGMTADEIKKYINQVAFSGVRDYVEKYQGKDAAQQIIGHFGLGFYSAFMVAHKVEIDTLSYQAGAKAAHWSCSGSTEFTIEDSDRKEIGTTITLHIAEDSLDMLESETISSILEKYCAFIKYPIELNGIQINDPTPIWTKSPTELNDDDYKAFFQRLFPLAPEPLFWIHLNVDYPFKLRGVLYFPKLQHELDASQGQVKLFCNQVYVADNCKELVPEFLTLLKGAIDCPDLPLNVSRSYLQKDAQTQLISQHITKKVADRLTGMARTEREVYEKYWDDIHPFVKFGMMRDNKFYERMSEFLIFKTSSDQFRTLDNYLEVFGEKTDKAILYTSDPVAQSSYVQLLKDAEIEAIVANTMMDQHFLPFLEMQNRGKYKFQRVDADISKHLMSDQAASKIVDPTDNKTNSDKLAEIFNKHLSKPNLKVRVEALKSDRVPAMLLIEENTRRMSEFAKFMPGMSSVGMPPIEQTLVVNESSPAVRNLLTLSRGINKETEVQMIANQIYDLAFLQHGKFSAEAMQSFISRSAKILEGIQ